MNNLPNKSLITNKKKRIVIVLFIVFICIIVVMIFLKNHKDEHNIYEATAVMEGSADTKVDTNTDTSMETKELSLLEITPEILNAVPKFLDAENNGTSPIVALIDKNEENNVALYVYNKEQLLICEGQQIWVLEDELGGPRLVFPTFGVSDYDGDGELEYAITYLAGSGTGINMIGMSIYEKVEGRLERHLLDIIKAAEQIEGLVNVKYNKEGGYAEVSLKDGISGYNFERVEFANSLWPPEEPFSHMAFGDIIDAEIVGKDLWISFQGGYVNEEVAPPLYDRRVIVKAKVIYHEDGSFSLDMLSLENPDKLYDYDTDKVYCYIDSFKNDELYVDDFEWVTLESDRAQELGLTDEDMPSGFYIYNDSGVICNARVSDDFVYECLSGEAVTKDEFVEMINEQVITAETPVIMNLKKGIITSATEKYVP